MSRIYTKNQIITKIYSYFSNHDYNNLYKASCINYRGETKDTKEPYSKVITDYLVKNLKEYKFFLSRSIIKREMSYKTKSHNGISDFNFDERPKGERREEKIAHAMYCQFKDNPTVFGKILDYQIPLKNTAKDSGVGKIDLLSSKAYRNNDKERNKVYILELKKDNSKESLLRCILEAYTYSNIVDREKLCSDFGLCADNTEFVIAPLVYKFDEFQNEVKNVEPLINAMDDIVLRSLKDITVEIFTWYYESGKYIIEVMEL